jgi:hypothetical protein
MPTAANQGTVFLRMNVSMVSLKWGDVLSTLLPGTVALFAVAPYFPSLNERIHNLDRIGVAGGFALLIASALAGGFLEALTRLTWERFVLVRLCPPKDILSNLNAENMDLYERGVQGSYKYATFYANFAWATILLLYARLDHGAAICSVPTSLLAGMILMLLLASYVQWTYYVNYQTKVFKEKGGKNAEQ